MRTQITSFFVCLIILFLGVFFAVEKEVSASLVDNEILVKYINREKLVVIKVESGIDLHEYISRVMEDAEVEYAEPNYVYRQAIIPSDTHFDKQWYFKKINAIEAWDVVKESEDIVIAVLDSGVDINHPDLNNNIWRNIKEADGNNIDDDKNGYVDDINGWDFINNVSDPGPKFKDDYTDAGVMHGTIVAGIAAASGNNAQGIAGVTWRSKIMALKVLDDNGEGRTDKVVEAIDYAIREGADIINLSFVGFGNSRSLERAIKRAHEAGLVIVAAAGNEQDQGDGYFLDETPMYPACHDGPMGENWVIGVAATDAMDQKASFSSFGFRCVDISAPGVSIFSTSVYSPHEYYNDVSFNLHYQGYWSGTSMAVPMVSGAVALIESINPALNKAGVYDALLDKTDNISRLNQQYLGRLGNGRLNVAASVKYAKNLLDNNHRKVIVAPYESASSTLRGYTRNGVKTDEFMLFDESFQGGARLASCDLDEDGESEIIVGAGSGGGPLIKVFGINGELKMQYYAYSENFSGGVDVACGDLNNDGFMEVIVGAGNGGGPHVRIFDRDGRLRGHFFAYDPRFRGGVNVAVGDVNGDGNDEIVTGSGVNGGPHVRIFNGRGELQDHFFAFNEDFRYGVNVSTARFDGATTNNEARIVASQAYGGNPIVKIFNNSGESLKTFYAYNENFKGGVNVAAGDIDKDGYDEIIAGAGPGGSPHVRIFEYNGKYIDSFYAFSEEFSGGVSVGVININ